MKMHRVYTFFFFLLACTLMLLFTGYSGGPAAAQNAGYTGAPGDDATFTCGVCHNSGTFGMVNIELTSQGSEATYSLAAPTPIEVKITADSGMPAGYGMQLIALNDDDTPLDVTYTNLSDNLQESVVDATGRKYLEHNGTSDSNVFTFDFQPNSVSESGTKIRFHVAATAVNGVMGNVGDNGTAGFTFEAEEKALAVELSSFTATRTRGGIELNWKTETEQDNDYFMVEHATNGMDFRALKTLAGAGTSQERNSYTYMHNTPLNGTNYYRLTMVDFDGKITYSDMIVQKFYTSGTINIYPQPATAYATIYVDSAIRESGLLNIHDMTGRLISTKDIYIESGENLFDLDCSQWVPGNYVITISGKQMEDKVFQFAKQ